MQPELLMKDCINVIQKCGYYYYLFSHGLYISDKNLINNSNNIFEFLKVVNFDDHIELLYKTYNIDEIVNNYINDNPGIDLNGLLYIEYSGLREILDVPKGSIADEQLLVTITVKSDKINYLRIGPMEMWVPQLGWKIDEEKTKEINK